MTLISKHLPWPFLLGFGFILSRRKCGSSWGSVTESGAVSLCIPSSSDHSLSARFSLGAIRVGKKEDMDGKERESLFHVQSPICPSQQVIKRYSYSLVIRKIGHHFSYIRLAWLG
jgi:hypothetical protein